MADKKKGILLRNSSGGKLSPPCEDLGSSVGVTSLNGTAEDATMLLKNTFSEGTQLPVINESFINQLKSGMDDSYLFPIFCTKSSRRKRNTNNSINSLNSSSLNQTFTKKSEELSGNSLDLTVNTSNNKVCEITNTNPFKRPRVKKNITSFALDSTQEENISFEDVSPKSKKVANPFKKNSKRKKFSVRFEKTFDSTDESIKLNDTTPADEDSISISNDSIKNEKVYQIQNPFKKPNKRKRYSLVCKLDTTEVGVDNEHSTAVSPQNIQDIVKQNPFKKANLRKFSLNATFNASDTSNSNLSNLIEKEIKNNVETQQLNQEVESATVKEKLSEEADKNVDKELRECVEKCSVNPAAQNNSINLAQLLETSSKVENLDIGSVTFKEVDIREESLPGLTGCKGAEINENNDEQILQDDESTPQISSMIATNNVSAVNNEHIVAESNSLSSHILSENLSEVKVVSTRNEANISNKGDVQTTSDNLLLSTEKQCPVVDVNNTSSIVLNASINSVCEKSGERKKETQSPIKKDNLPEIPVNGTCTPTQQKGEHDEAESCNSLVSQENIKKLALPKVANAEDTVEVSNEDRVQISPNRNLMALSEKQRPNGEVAVTRNNTSIPVSADPTELNRSNSAMPKEKKTEIQNRSKKENSLRFSLNTSYNLPDVSSINDFNQNDTGATQNSETQLNQLDSINVSKTVASETKCVNKEILSNRLGENVGKTSNDQVEKENNSFSTALLSSEDEKKHKITYEPMVDHVEDIIQLDENEGNVCSVNPITDLSRQRDATNIALNESYEAEKRLNPFKKIRKSKYSLGGQLGVNISLINHNETVAEDVEIAFKTIGSLSEDLETENKLNPFRNLRKRKYSLEGQFEHSTGNNEVAIKETTLSELAGQAGQNTVGLHKDNVDVNGIVIQTDEDHSKKSQEKSSGSDINTINPTCSLIEKYVVHVKSTTGARSSISENDSQQTTEMEIKDLCDKDLSNVERRIEGVTGNLEKNNIFRRQRNSRYSLVSQLDISEMHSKSESISSMAIKQDVQEFFLQTENPSSEKLVCNIMHVPVSQTLTSEVSEKVVSPEEESANDTAAKSYEDLEEASVELSPSFTISNPKESESLSISTSKVVNSKRNYSNSFSSLEEIRDYNDSKLEKSDTFQKNSSSNKLNKEVNGVQSETVQQISLEQPCKEKSIVIGKEVVKKTSLQRVNDMSLVTSNAYVRETCKSSSEISLGLDNHCSKLDNTSRLVDSQLNGFGKNEKGDELSVNVMTPNLDGIIGESRKNIANRQNKPNSLLNCSDSINNKDATVEKPQISVTFPDSNVVGIDDVLSAISAVEADEIATNNALTPSITLELDPSCILDDERDIFVSVKPENLSYPLKHTSADSFAKSEGISISVGSLLSENMMEFSKNVSQDDSKRHKNHLVITDKSQETKCPSLKKDEEVPRNKENKTAYSKEENCNNQETSLQNEKDISHIPNSKDISLKCINSEPKSQSLPIETSDDKLMPTNNQNLSNNSGTAGEGQTKRSQYHIDEAHLEVGTNKIVLVHKSHSVEETIPESTFQSKQPHLSSDDVDNLTMSTVTTVAEVHCSKESDPKQKIECSTNNVARLTKVRRNVMLPIVTKETNSSSSIVTNVNKNKVKRKHSNKEKEIEIHKEDEGRTKSNESLPIAPHKQSPKDKVKNIHIEDNVSLTHRSMPEIGSEMQENIHVKPQLKVTEPEIPRNEEKSEVDAADVPVVSESKKNISGVTVNLTDMLPTPPPSNVQNSDALSVNQSPQSSQTRTEKEPLMEDECFSNKSDDIGRFVRRKSPRIVGNTQNKSNDILNSYKNESKKHKDNNNLTTEEKNATSLKNITSNEDIRKEINYNIDVASAEDDEEANDVNNQPEENSVCTEVQKVESRNEAKISEQIECLENRLPNPLNTDEVSVAVRSTRKGSRNTSVSHTSIVKSNIEESNQKIKGAKMRSSLKDKNMTLRKSSRNPSVADTSIVKSNIDENKKKIENARIQTTLNDKNMTLRKSSRTTSVANTSIVKSIAEEKNKQVENAPMQTPSRDKKSMTEQSKRNSNGKVKPLASFTTKGNSEEFGELSLSFDVSAISNDKLISTKRKKYKSTPLVQRATRSKKVLVSVAPQSENGLEKAVKEKVHDSVNDFEFVAPKLIPRKSSITAEKKTRRSVTFRPHSSLIPAQEISKTPDKSSSVNRRKLSGDSQTSLGRKNKNSQDQSYRRVSTNTSTKNSTKRLGNYSAAENKTNKDISYETSLEVSEITPRAPKQRKRLLFHSTPKNRVILIGTPSVTRKRIRLTGSEETSLSSSSLYTTTGTDAVQSDSYSPTTRTLRSSSKSQSNGNLISYDSHTCMATKITTATIHQSNLRSAIPCAQKESKYTSRGSVKPCNSEMVLEESSCFNRPHDDSFSTSYSDESDPVRANSVLEKSAIIVETEERSLRNGTLQMTLRSSRTTLQRSAVYTESQLSNITQTTFNENSLVPEKSLSLVCKFSKNKKRSDSIFGEVEKKKVISHNEPLPRLAKPAKWIKKELYTFLEKKLGSKYSLEKRYHSERLVLLLHNAVTNTLLGHPELSLQSLKEELIKYNICKTQLDYFTFLNLYTPLEFIKKVIPMGRAYSNEDFKHEVITVSCRLE
ncbi:uncharacterized protein isoform X2 [Rhodnius prolixus]